MTDYLQVLWNYLLISAPYLLFGLFLSGLIHQLVPMAKIKNWLGGNRLGSVLRAAIVGVPLPLCSCSVIPTAVTLRKGGAGNGATAAFLISTPESGVDSISMTYALMDLPMTIIRPIAAFVSAFVAGALQLRFNDFHLEENEGGPSPCCASKSEHFQERSLVQACVGVFRFGFGKLLNDISVWLSLGILLGALIDFMVPDNFFSSLTMIENRLMILVIGIPLYICASASTPIAVSLMLKGLSPGSALLFLLIGPATNISNIAVLQKYIGKKGVALNIFSVISVALVFSFIADWMYLNLFSLSLNEQLHVHEHRGAWWEFASAIILLLLLFKGMYMEKLGPWLKNDDK